MTGDPHSHPQPYPHSYPQPYLGCGQRVQLSFKRINLSIITNCEPENLNIIGQFGNRTKRLVGLVYFYDSTTTATINTNTTTTIPSTTTTATTSTTTATTTTSMKYYYYYEDLLTT